MNNQVVLNPLQSAVYTLIQRFVRRQEIVRDAMNELRPDLVQLAIHSSTGQEWTEGTLQKLLRLAETCRNIPQRDYWGKENEWSYYIHGVGCRLIHTITGEPIEWDAPNVRKFDRFWLLNYLEWLLTKDADDEAVSVVRSGLAGSTHTLEELIFPVLEQLRQSRILSGPDGQGKYTLTAMD